MEIKNMAYWKAKNSPLKQKSEAEGYDPDEEYFQSLLKAVQENPEPESYTKEHMAKHQKELYQSAKQKQIIDFRKKSLTPVFSGEGDYSEHNIAARKTEGTIQEQEQIRKENEAKKAK